MHLHSKILNPFLSHYKKTACYIALMGLVITLVFSCKKDKSPTLDLGYDYFPNKTGTWVSYDVDSIVYNDFTGNIDTFAYQVKELIESDYVDNGGRPGQRIERFKRTNDTQNWVLTDVWFMIRTNTRAEKTEENFKFVKLAFPVKEGAKWDGNAFNTIEEWEYECTDTHVANTINTLGFDSTVTVQQFENFNLIENQNYKEIYAKHVGLVYKHIIDLKTEVNGTIKSGVKFTQQVNDFGRQ